MPIAVRIGTILILCVDVAAIFIGNHSADITGIAILILIAVNRVSETVCIRLRINISVCIHQGIHTLGCRHSKQCLQLLLICIGKSAAL